MISGLLLSAALVALSPVSALVVGEEIVVTASRCYGNECDDDAGGGGSNYYYLGSGGGGSGGYAISVPSTPQGDSTYSNYNARQAGLTSDFVSSNSHISSGSFRYVAPTYIQPPIIRSYDVAINRMKSFVARRDEARNSVQHMDHAQTRLEIVEHASDSMRVAKEYYLAKQFEEGDIASTIADTMLDIATSTAPVISWVRDLYEAISGKDMLSGERLGTFSRSMAVFGSMTFGFGSKAGKAINILEKIVRTEEKVPFHTAKKLFNGMFGGKPLTEIKDTLRFFKEHKFWKQEDKAFKDFAKAFEMRTTKVTVLTEDIKVYRYYNPEYTVPRGNWLTPKKTLNPVEDLALPFGGHYEVHEWIIPKGTKVLEGVVAPLNNRRGGAYQYFVPNMEVLK